MLLLNVFITLCVFLAILFGLLILYYQKVKKANKNRQLQGLTGLKRFRLLLALVQQHRGLTMGYLNGDESLLKRIHSIQDQVAVQLSDIDKNQLSLQNNLIWAGINDHWSRLSNQFTQYDGDHNFRQHCNLIVNLQNLIEDNAEQHHLQELICNNQQHANFLWVQLLNTAEHIGQARAVGTSIAAAKNSTSIQRIKLNYLKNFIDVFLSDENSQSDSKYPKAMLTAINTQLLIDKPNIDAEEFFNLATSALEVVFAQFDYYIEDLLSNLKS